jgi:peptide chain release factor 1
VLFKRARSIAKQHDELSATLSEGFDPKVAKRVGELAPIVKVLKDWDKANEVRQLR